MAPAAASAQVSLNTTAETGIQGRLLSADQSGLIVFESESRGKTGIRTADVVSMVFSDAPAVSKDSDVEIELHNGDVFFGELDAVAAEGQALSMRDRSAGRVLIPDLGQVKWMRLPQAKGKKLMLGREAASDFVFHQNGDRISGTVDSISGKGVVIERSGETRTLPFADLLAVYVAPLVPVKPPDAVYAVFVLRNGGRTRGIIKSFAEGLFTVATGFGRDLEIPVQEVLNLSFRNGNFSYLSDETPAEIIEIRALFDEPLSLKPPFDPQGVFNLRNDRSYDGNPLTMAGKRYYKGLGSHSFVEIRYELGGRFRKFEALAGIDDEVLGRVEKGSVIFRVRVDGVEKAATPAMRGGTAPVRLSVDLAGAAALSLVVDYTGDVLEMEDDDVNDHADWADAILVRK